MGRSIESIRFLFVGRSAPFSPLSLSFSSFCHSGLFSRSANPVCNAHENYTRKLATETPTFISHAENQHSRFFQWFRDLQDKMLEIKVKVDPLLRLVCMARTIMQISCQKLNIAEAELTLINSQSKWAPRGGGVGVGGVGW